MARRQAVADPGPELEAGTQLAALTIDAIVLIKLLDWLAGKIPSLLGRDRTVTEPKDRVPQFQERRANL